MKKNDYIELLNEENEIEKFLIEAYLEIEDTEYAVVFKENEEEGIIFKIGYDEENNPYFNIVEEEKEVQEVIDAYESLVD